MRSIEDQTGVVWDVAVGKESYGSMVLLFFRRDDDEIRRISIDANSRLEAEAMMRALDADDLRSRLLAASVLKPAAPAR
ncbi:MAG: hypothetical protein R3337_06740 [Gammaproteobacteria bacterium]|nr:hypothetical protein [Gammaproteobacteria bacterium]